ncbi:MAG: hypothetical protein R3C69_14585 [Geminicoccaceae bacterium]
MWQLAQPLVEEWMIANLGPKARLQQALADGLQTAGRLPDLVRRLDEALERDRTRHVVVDRPKLFPVWFWPLLVGFLIGLAVG